MEGAGRHSGLPPWLREAKCLSPGHIASWEQIAWSDQPSSHLPMLEQSCFSQGLEGSSVHYILIRKVGSWHFSFFFFFMLWTTFKVLIEFVTILLLLFYVWVLGHEACGISTPWPPALEGKVLATGPPSWSWHLKDISRWESSGCGLGDGGQSVWEDLEPKRIVKCLETI